MFNVFLMIELTYNVIHDIILDVVTHDIFNQQYKAVASYSSNCHLEAHEVPLGHLALFSPRNAHL